MSDEKKVNILVIDDDANLLRMMELLLERTNYSFHGASNGVEGLALADEVKPDLVVLDISMPFMKGTEVCRRLRQNPETSRIPIIIMSSLERVEDKLAGFEAGADDYVTKPVNPKELLARINALLARSRYQQPPGAKIISVLGAKGGVGVTTLSVNLAASLQEREHAVSFAELHASFGTACYHVNARPEPNLGPLLASDAKDVGRPEVERQVIRHESGLKLLLAPTGDCDVSLSAEHVEIILQTLERSAEYVVLDLPTNLNDGVRRAVELSDYTLLLTEPDPLSALCTRARLQTFESWKLTQKVGVVAVGRVPSGTLLTRMELESEVTMGMMGRPEFGGGGGGWRDAPVMPAVNIVAVIPPAPEAFQDAVRQQVPLVRLEPSSRAARAVSELADKVLEAVSLPKPVDL